MDSDAHAFALTIMLLFILVSLVSLLAPVVTLPFEPAVSKAPVIRHGRTSNAATLPPTADVPTLLASISTVTSTASTSPSRVDASFGQQPTDSSGATSSSSSKAPK